MFSLKPCSPNTRQKETKKGLIQQLFFQGVCPVSKIKIHIVSTARRKCCKLSSNFVLTPSSCMWLLSAYPTDFLEVKVLICLSSVQAEELSVVAGSCKEMYQSGTVSSSRGLCFENPRSWVPSLKMTWARGHPCNVEWEHSLRRLVFTYRCKLAQNKPFYVRQHKPRQWRRPGVPQRLKLLHDMSCVSGPAVQCLRSDFHSSAISTPGWSCKWDS